MSSNVPVWPYRPKPEPGEIFSSYLARIAYAHGQSPYRFYAYFLPGVPIWNRDIDRCASDALIEQIAVRCGLPVDQIAAMTLRGPEKLLAGQSMHYELSIAGAAPWINVAGVFHRVRRRFGMQYCPQCLKEAHYYRTSWRYSFVTTCVRHQRNLRDSCQHCDAPVIYHRMDSFQPVCSVCGHELMHDLPRSGKDAQIEKSSTLQEMFLKILETGSVKLNRQPIAAGEFFPAVRRLFQIAKTAIRKAANNDALPNVYRDCPTGCMEFLRIDERTQQVLALSEMLRDWPHAFLNFAHVCRITQAAVGDINAMPVWVGAVLATLLPGKRRGEWIASGSLVSKLSKLHRHKEAGWRTERATLLLHAAGRGR